MDPQTQGLSEDEFALLVRRAGRPVAKAQRQIMFDARGRSETMLERVRKLSAPDRARVPEPEELGGKR